MRRISFLILSLLFLSLRFGIGGVYGNSFLLAWGSPGSSAGQFIEPSGVAVDSSGNVYVTDLLNNRVEKFTGSGTFITQWGSQGSGAGQFEDPHGIAVDSSGNVYVADWTNIYGNGRVEKFTSSGTFITQWGSIGSGVSQNIVLGSIQS
jgi:DNA-binding beta-propeller fold protein YncE